MPTTSSQPVDPFGRYRNPFLDMYENSCGDRGSYEKVRPNFFNFVTSRTTESLRDGRFRDAISYAAVAMGLAPVGVAANTFEMFLNDKTNCHESSIAGEAFSAAKTFVRNPAKLSFYGIEKREFLSISDPTRLYIAWQKFVTRYMELVANLEDVVKAAMKVPLDATVRREIWAVANRAEIFAGIVSRTVKLLKTGFADSVAWTMVRQQRGRINNFRNTITQLMEAVSGDLRFENHAEQAMKDFIETFKELRDPFNWLDQVVSWYQPRDGGAKKFNMVFPERRSGLRIDKANALWELIDWIIIIAEKFGSEQKPLTIEFGLNDEKNLVIRMPLVETHVWSYIDAILRRLKGSRLTVLRESAFFTEVRVPLKEADAEQGGGGSVTGIFMPNETSGSLPPRRASPAALHAGSRHARGFRPVVNPYFSPVRVWGVAGAVFRAPAVFAN